MKRKMSIWIVLLLIIVAVSPAFASAVNQPTSFTANAEQLEIMNNLRDKGLSTGDVLKKVAPKYFANLPYTAKQELLKEKFGTRIPTAVAYAKADSTGTLTLKNSGKSLAFFTNRNLGYVSTSIAIRVEIINKATNKYVAYSQGTVYNKSTYSLSGLVDPPTGTYSAWTQHQFYNSGHGYALNITTQDVYYKNPNQANTYQLRNQ